MRVKIGILNCYADEPESAPSACYFSDIVRNTTIINICHNEAIKNINDYDGYIVSGSRSCHKDKIGWITALKGLIKQIYNENIPCLAVCFGHQVLADMFGGTTVKDFGGEYGFQNVPTVARNKHIKLFSGLPNSVKIYQSHNDAVLKSPPKSINTIHNDKCVQYYQYGSIHSIQSHPEISVTTAIKIVKKDNQDIDSILNGINENNIKSHIVLENFIKFVE